ncbi:MAG TPA: type III polyketide synthase [Mariniphaga sp.]|nr:type III polyketide synthase [Mariniphaga sp.]
MSRIISTGVAVPEFAASQDQILEYMSQAYNDDTVSRKLRILFHSSSINTRYSVVPDFSNHSQNNLFFGNGSPNVEMRMNLYKKNAAGLAMHAIENLFNKLNTDILSFGITHLITVTCTGIYSPGLETELMENLNLPDTIFHTSINFLGCNAAFPAQKIADAFARSDSKARVLVVCVELCTIHFQPKNNNDNLLSNTIFSDGAAAALIVSDEIAQKHNVNGLGINNFYSDVLGDGKALMGWNVKPLNFEMILNPELPSFIGKNLNQFIEEATRKLDLIPLDSVIWAVHPGGRKILDQVRLHLDLEKDALEDSYHVLKDYGNMSSSTILFILNRIMEKNLKPGEKVLAIGFGPGISVDIAVYHYEP